MIFRHACVYAIFYVLYYGYNIKSVNTGSEGYEDLIQNIGISQLLGLIVYL